ncbi:MAG: HD domain-containing protein [Magnetococcales bacterium]|nr:HD domain-containing protein [Magnetococcales bacterium]
MTPYATMRTQRKRMIVAAKRVFTKDEITTIKKALFVAEKHHIGQYRHDGSLFMSHPVGVAQSMLDYEYVCFSSFVAAILHDVLEDGQAADRHSDVASFGPEVYDIVNGCTKIPTDSHGSSTLQKTYGKLLRASAINIKTMVVKGFDVLHNSQSFDVHSEEKARYKSNLALIYVGIFRRLGARKLAADLLNNVLPYLEPIQYQHLYKTLVKAQNAGQKRRKKIIRQFWKIKGLNSVLHGQNAVRFQAHTLAEYFHVTPSKWFISNVRPPFYTMEISVRNNAAAWWLLGNIHKLFQPYARTIRDYLNSPKLSGFQGLASQIFLDKAQMYGDGVPLAVTIAKPSDHKKNQFGSLLDPSTLNNKFKTFREVLQSFTLSETDIRIDELPYIGFQDRISVIFAQDRRALAIGQGDNILSFYRMLFPRAKFFNGAVVNGIKQFDPELQLHDGDVVDLLRPSSRSIRLPKG